VNTLAAVAPGAVVGIDVGGTRIKAALLSTDGVVLGETTRPTPTDIGGRIGAVAAEIVHELSGMLPQGRSRAPSDASSHAPSDASSHVPSDAAGDVPPKVLAVGVAVPGWVDDAAGRALWSANLGWRDLDLRDAVAAHCHLPVAVGQDVRAGLQGEHRFGAARGVHNVLFVPLGTGLASALLIAGRPVAGTFCAGEIGHVVIEPGGELCGCGQRGCLETVASAGAIGRRWSARSGSPGDAADVARLTAEGDPLAASVWREAVEALAATLAPVVAATGTELVLVGGGLVRAGEVLLGPLRAALTSRLGICDGVAIAAAALGDRAGALGAAALALDLLSTEPIPADRVPEGR